MIGIELGKFLGHSIEQQLYKRLMRRLFGGYSSFVRSLIAREKLILSSSRIFAIGFLMDLFLCTNGTPFYLLCIKLQFTWIRL